MFVLSIKYICYNQDVRLNVLYHHAMKYHYYAVP